MEAMTIPQAAKRWEMSQSSVRQAVRAGRVQGAYKVARDWLIPKDAEKPKDGRKKWATTKR